MAQPTSLGVLAFSSGVLAFLFYRARSGTIGLTPRAQQSPYAF